MIQEAGKYEVHFDIQQDPSTVNARFAANDYARSKISSITKMDIKGSLNFEVEPKEVKAFVAQDVTFEEMQSKKKFLNLKFKTSLTIMFSLFGMQI